MVTVKNLSGGERVRSVRSKHEFKKKIGELSNIHYIKPVLNHVSRRNSRISRGLDYFCGLGNWIIVRFVVADILSSPIFFTIEFSNTRTAFGPYTRKRATSEHRRQSNSRFSNTRRRRTTTFQSRQSTIPKRRNACYLFYALIIMLR